MPLSRVQVPIILTVEQLLPQRQVGGPGVDKTNKLRQKQQLLQSVQSLALQIAMASHATCEVLPVAVQNMRLPIPLNVDEHLPLALQRLLRELHRQVGGLGAAKLK